MAAEHFSHLLKRASVLLAIDLEACGEKATLRPRFKKRVVKSGATVVEASFGSDSRAFPGLPH